MEEHRLSKIDCLMKFLNDSAWLCMEKLKKHSFETKEPKQLLKILNKSQKIRKEFAFIGALKVPCTLP